MLYKDLLPESAKKYEKSSYIRKSNFDLFKNSSDKNQFNDLKEKIKNINNISIVSKANKNDRLLTYNNLITENSIKTNSNFSKEVKCKICLN